jgi:hypothetical protein
VADETQQRLCPYCHTMIALGQCPIVGTNLLPGAAPPPNGRNGRRTLAPRPRDQRHIGRADDLDDAGPETESPLPSRTAVYQWWGEYPVLAPPPAARVATGAQRWRERFAGRPLLPIGMMGRAEDLPARACPSCRHPLPTDLDERDFLTVAVIGTTGVGKTHYLASMVYEACRLQKLRPHGFTEFVPDEATAHRYHTDYYEPVFDDGSVLDQTNPLKPAETLSFRVTLDQYEPFGLMFHDVAGETLSNRQDRARDASFVQHADAAILLIDPVWLPVLRRTLASNGRRHGGRNQADLLSACIQQLDHRARLQVPYAITVSKSDLLVPLLAHRPRFADPPPTGLVEWDIDLRFVDGEVRSILQGAGALDLLAISEQLGQVSFHAVAPIGAEPTNGHVVAAKPLRCLDPLATLLGRLRPKLRRSQP